MGGQGAEVGVGEQQQEEKHDDRTLEWSGVYTDKQDNMIRR